MFLMLNARTDSFRGDCTDAICVGRQIADLSQRMVIDCPAAWVLVFTQAAMPYRCTCSH